MPEITVVPPPMEWAQRNDILYVTVAAECKDVDFKFTDDSLHFKANSADNTKHYEVTLNFLHKINPENVVSKNTARCIEYTIKKAETGPYWASLTNDKKKPHFLKADFNKWRDEESDYEDEEGGGGGLGDAAGFGNMQEMFANLNSGAASKPNFDDFGDEEKEDSDDEEIPNLE